MKKLAPLILLGLFYFDAYSATTGFYSSYKRIKVIMLIKNGVNVNAHAIDHKRSLKNKSRRHHRYKNGGRQDPGTPYRTF